MSKRSDSNVKRFNKWNERSWKVQIRNLRLDGSCETKATLIVLNMRGLLVLGYGWQRDTGDAWEWGLPQVHGKRTQAKVHLPISKGREPDSIRSRTWDGRKFKCSARTKSCFPDGHELFRFPFLVLTVNTFNVFQCALRCRRKFIFTFRGVVFVNILWIFCEYFDYIEVILV